MSLPAVSEARTPVVPNMTKRASRRGWARPTLDPYNGHTTRAGQAQPRRDAQKFAEKTRTRERRNGVAKSYFSPRKITLRYALNDALNDVWPARFRGV